MPPPDYLAPGPLYRSTGSKLGKFTREWTPVSRPAQRKSTYHSRKVQSGSKSTHRQRHLSTICVAQSPRVYDESQSFLQPTVPTAYRA